MELITLHIITGHSTSCNLFCPNLHLTSKVFQEKKPQDLGSYKNEMHLTSKLRFKVAKINHVRFQEINMPFLCNLKVLPPKW